MHWGSRTCPSGSSLLYEGFAAGKMYNDAGGTSDTLCMHSSPQGFTWAGAASSGSEYRNILHGAEYAFHDNLPDNPRRSQVTSKGDVACAMCQTDSVTAAYVQWGRASSCSNGHTTLYSGYAMSERSDKDVSGSTTSGHKSSDMVCMDSEIATHAASSQSDDNGKLFFLSQFASGSADESKYKVGHEVGCSVCGV